jgi:hypothetical protein
VTNNGDFYMTVAEVTFPTWADLQPLREADQAQWAGRVVQILKDSDTPMVIRMVFEVQYTNPRPRKGVEGRIRSLTALIVAGPVSTAARAVRTAVASAALLTTSGIFYALYREQQLNLTAESLGTDHGEIVNFLVRVGEEYVDLGACIDGELLALLKAVGPDFLNNHVDWLAEYYVDRAEGREARAGLVEAAVELINSLKTPEATPATT